MRRLLSLLALLLSTVALMAVPAHRGAAQVRQPDGSTITLRLYGDEWMNFHATDDGYSVVKDQHGYYVYAQLKEGRLEATERVAHDIAERSSSELEWLKGIRKFQTPSFSERMAQKMVQEQNRRTSMLNTRRAALYDYSTFRGLVILIEFNDRFFSRSDYAQVIDDMLNQPNYKGYDNSRYGKFTGSVRDYFVDNSMGKFEPQFDVVGPVRVGYSQYDPHQVDDVAPIIFDALLKIDGTVDFTRYDADKNGVADLIYIVFAGLGSHFEANDERLVWPHAGMLTNNGPVVFDGVRMNNYACSTELYGDEEAHILDGIGTFCHEFSHVLGLPDLYDTDYEKSGGESNHPDEWLIMSGGSYANYGRTPVGYSLYERYAAGFALPEVIDGEGSKRLNPLALFNKGYRINTEVANEFFLLENRQPSQFKWDKYLPGHGLLVFRVDSTNAVIWERNQTNVNPRHNYFTMIRAGGDTGATDSDPFPGKNEVTELDNYTNPANLLTWAGKNALWGIYDITEKGNVIRFDVRTPQDPNGIILPKVATKEDILGDDAVIYNLQGQRVSPTTKGIVISRGRKLLK
jgi:M6 family metalloprotease-like protein